MNLINSVNNEIIKNTAQLKKSRERKIRETFIVDGKREITLAIKSGLTIKLLFYCPELIKKKENFVANFIGVSAEKLVEVSKIVFKKICYKESPDGFLALIKTPKKSLNDIKLSSNPLLMVLENVEKPGNLGAIIRTAYAVGVEAIIINDNQTDIFNPNVIRASEGFIFKKIVVSASLPETAKWLKEHKIKSIATATNAKKIYTDSDLSGAIAIILGSEAEGLSQNWLKNADDKIKIPMVEDIDSLNVSVVAAIISFEAVRQRSK